MLEYHAHYASLEQARAAIQTTFAGNAALLAKVGKLCAAADADPDAAILGSFVDLLFDHASSDGVELELLDQAANLWAQGRALYDQVTDIRTSLETALLDPSAPGALALVTSALTSLASIKGTALALNADAAALHAEIDPLPYLKEHPRQQDIPAKKWGWRDAFLGRRTDAFAENLVHAAKSERAAAFAFGALASYGANVTGSAYLGCVVGGPRRLHRYRDRLARNTIGAWLQSQLATPECAMLARSIGFRSTGFAYGLPSDLSAALEKATAEAWPSRIAPDFNLGLSRMVQHLQLLNGFKRPDLPNPPPPGLSSGDPSGGLSILSDQDPNLPNIGVDTGGDVSGNIGDTNVANSKMKGGDICLAILAVIATIGIALLIYCIAQWAQHKKCDPGDFFNSAQGSDAPDPHQTTQQQLVAMSDPDAASHIVQELFSLQMMLWQGFDSAAAYLSVTGLIYPDEFTIASPLYQQFLITPPRASWPFREDPNEIDDYQFDPTTPVEQPAAANPPFAPGESPLAFAGPWSPSLTQSATGIIHDVLQNALGHSREAENRDLDGDRGYRHPCWGLRSGSSIHDAVLAVEVLPYGAD